MVADEDVEQAVADADLDQVADDVEDIDEDRSHWDKAPYWAWLVLVFGGTVAAIGVAIETGTVGEWLAFTDPIDLSDPAQEAVTWLTRIFLFVTLVAALVVAPGDYIATLLRILDGFSYDDEDK
jgi:hypothetical protein